MLERLQESDKIVLVLLRKVKSEARIVEVDGVHKSSGGAVVKVRRTPCKAAQMGPLILPTWSNLPSIKACPRSVVVLQLLVG
jgi:hypothetical protein